MSKVDIDPNGGCAAVKELKVNALDVTIVCHICGCELDGFVTDPRGQSHACDECGAELHIAEDAVITFW